MLIPGRECADSALQLLSGGCHGNGNTYCRQLTPRTLDNAWSQNTAQGCPVGEKMINENYNSVDETNSLSISCLLLPVVEEVGL